MSLRKAADPNVVTTWDIGHSTGTATRIEPMTFGGDRLSGVRPEGTEAMGQVEMTDMDSEDPDCKRPVSEA